jgi:hypothetical protein
VGHGGLPDDGPLWSEALISPPGLMVYSFVFWWWWLTQIEIKSPAMMKGASIDFSFVTLCRPGKKGFYLFFCFSIDCVAFCWRLVLRCCLHFIDRVAFHPSDEPAPLRGAGDQLQFLQAKTSSRWMDLVSQGRINLPLPLQLLFHTSQLVM